MPNPDRVAVLLDRDGTLIEDVGYPRDPTLIRLLPGAAGALREFGRLGFLLVLVSNQSGVGRELISPAEAAAVAGRFEDLLRSEGIRLDGSYYCYHTPREGCVCRKPAPGMLLRASAELGIDLVHSVLVGDKASDIEGGRRAGCSTVLFSSLALVVPEPSADFVAHAWGETLAWVARRPGVNRRAWQDRFGRRGDQDGGIR